MRYAHPPGIPGACLLNTLQIMAKGSLMSVQRGKLGKMVAYRVTNSNNGDTQGWRERIYTINNPRTAAQASQRMKLPAAVNFYRGLQDLLNHSWQGVRYGGMSRQKFMSLAMGPNTVFIPFVPKGTTDFIPGEYPVSMGSVPCPAISSVEDNFVNVILADFEFDDEKLATMTFGEYSRLIIAGSPYLRNGDEITFIRVVEINGQYIPQHSYVVLDTQATELALKVWGSAKFYIGNDGAVYNIAGASDSEYTDTNDKMVAAAVIISRHPANNSTTWMRSTSKMVVSKELKNKWMTDAAYQAAEPTYRNAAQNLTSDWLLNQGENTHEGETSGSGSNGLQVQNVPFKNGSGSVFAAAIVDGGAEYPVYLSKNGKRYYGVKSGESVVFGDANEIAAAQTTQPSWITFDKARERMPRVDWVDNVSLVEKPEP